MFHQPRSHYVAVLIVMVVAARMITRFHDHPDVLGLIAMGLLGLSLLWPVEEGTPS